MAAELLTAPRPASVLQPWPRIAVCRCGTEILLARHVGAGRPVKLEPVPVLPDGGCGQCHGTGRRSLRLELGRRTVRPRGRLDEPGCLIGATSRHTVPCPSCRGTGRRGEPLDGDLVLVSAHDGIARPFTADRGSWEAAHRRHCCR